MFDWTTKSAGIQYIIFSGRRDIQTYPDWRQLWNSNTLDDYAKVEGSAGPENNTVNNVTVQLGATAYLHCHVRSPGDRIAGTDVSGNLNFSELQTVPSLKRRGRASARCVGIIKTLGEFVFKHPLRWQREYYDEPQGMSGRLFAQQHRKWNSCFVNFFNNRCCCSYLTIYI